MAVPGLLGKVGKAASKALGRDAEYMAAVQAGDMTTAQRLVNERAQEAGYSVGNDYRMQHRAPNAEYDVSLADVRSSGLVPDDYWTHPQYYLAGDMEQSGLNSMTSLFRGMDARAEKGRDPSGATMFVYRAVPKNVKDSHIRNGDWVTPSREYAQLEGESISGGYRIIAEEVPAKNLYWDGNSPAELGYDDKKNYAYKNTKNNRKLIDPITYDDSGKIIPPSKRFNTRSDETNYAAPATAIGAGGLLAAMTPDRAAQAALAGQMSPTGLMQAMGGFTQASQALRQAEQNRRMPAMRGEMSGPQTAIQRGAFDVGMAADRAGLGGTAGAYMNVSQGARPGLIDAILSGVELSDAIGPTQLGQGLLSR